VGQHRDRATSDHGQSLHVHGEGVDLHAIDLAAGKGARQRIDADVLRLDVAGPFIELAIELGHLDPATLAGGGAQGGILAEQAEHMQAAGDQLLERHLIVLGDCGQADVELVGVILGTKVERRAELGQ